MSLLRNKDTLKGVLINRANMALKVETLQAKAELLTDLAEAGLITAETSAEKVNALIDEVLAL